MIGFWLGCFYGHSGSDLFRTEIRALALGQPAKCVCPLLPLDRDQDAVSPKSVPGPAAFAVFLERRNDDQHAFGRDAAAILSGP